jgi:hypothetical protein
LAGKRSVGRVLIIERENRPKVRRRMRVTPSDLTPAELVAPPGAARPEHGDGDAGGCRQAGSPPVEKNAPEMKAIGR